METLRYPTLAAWAKDMGDAIRERDGTTDPIPHQDMPDRVRAIPAGGSDVDLSQIQTKPENVLETETYMGADGEMHYGTMPEIADETITLDGVNTSHTMEKGHHGGGGVVRIVPDDTGNTFTPSKDGGTYDAPAGMVYTRIILEPIPDIYVDPTDASATAADVLSTATFYGKAGTKETGEIATKTGKQGSNVVSNGNKYIPVGYHDGTSYFNVNVSQTIVDGEDSTNCTAEESDVRYRKTFRSGGAEKTGKLRTVSVPKVVVDVDTTSSSSNVQIEAYTNASTTEGILPAGSSGAVTSKTIPKYTGETSFLVTTGSKTVPVAGKYCANDIILAGAPAYSGSYTVTPTSSDQTLYTAGNYLSNNIIVQSAAPAIHSAVGPWSSKSSVTIAQITEMPQLFRLHYYGNSGYPTLVVLDVDFSVITNGSSKAYEVITGVSTEWSGFESRSYGSGAYTSGTVIKDDDGIVNISLSGGGLTLTSSSYNFDGDYTIIWM